MRRKKGGEGGGKEKGGGGRQGKIETGRKGKGREKGCMQLSLSNKTVD